MPKTNHKSPQFNIFNLTRNPLSGFNLIDASAGTGKTYTICGLVLRLLLEKDLSIDQILVVTYTEAATKDLRDRIRQKLRQGLEAITTGKSDDSFLQEYLEHIPDLIEAQKRFSDALRCFDEAAIFTIHSFCQRQLLENSLESNTLFDTELVADQSYLIQEIIEDFWRRNFYRRSNLFTEYGSDKLNPDVLLDFLAPFLPRPSLQFIPAIELKEGCDHLSENEVEFVEAYRAVCTAWGSARSDVSQDMLNSNGLKRNIYKKTRIPEMLTGMDDMAASCRPSLYLFDAFAYFTSSKISAATKLNETPNILPFYEICENLLQIQSNLSSQYDRCLLAIKKKLTDNFYHEFDLRKKRDNIFSFDDLLRRLHEAFSGPGGPDFARAVAQKYPAVLIDEFQDTDPLQFEIFSAIYKKQSLLFLIGDPKQAIYSFRGADIFTYMDAAASRLVSHYTLGVNHRSTPELVTAANTLFGRSQKPFIFDAISFQPVSSAPKIQPECLTIDGQQEAPFILWHLDNSPVKEETVRSANKKTVHLTKTTARRTIITAVASEVTRLLTLAAENRACINGEKLHPGDIAILVRKNDEARKMQQALTKCQVPSVLHSGDNLFTSDEAREIALLLEAVAAPHDIRKVKTGLLTRLIGLQANDIELSSSATEGVIEHWLTRFKAYHALWNRYGFIQMFWTIMAENRIRAKILGFENGERSLTNILHLAEILHQEACEQGMNMTALLGYLHDRLAGDQAKTTEQQLRLESDADRVKIVTIHKAKGLEYSVVFCPFTWEGSRLPPGKGCIFHQQKKTDNRTELIFDGGSPELETHLQLAMQEEMAENLRLLYVAVTRAIHRCYLVWGQIKGAESSAPAYLLHQGVAETAVPQQADTALKADNDLIQKTAARFLKLSDNNFLADLKELAEDSEGTIRLSSVFEKVGTYPFQTENESIPLNPRSFTGTIASDWKISSFSALATYKSAAEQFTSDIQEVIPGQDDFSAIQKPDEEQNHQFHGEVKHDIFSFPHGAEAGTMLHELLEQVDFGAVNQTATDKIIYEKLLSFGYDPAWHPAIVEMLINLSKVVLHKNIPDLTLSSISSNNCLHELEFYFPLSRITPESLKTVFSQHSMKNTSSMTGSLMEQQLDRLTFSPARGFMKGFIDLVFEFQGKFYLVDWKSNYLGSHVENYHNDRLTDAIYSGFYFLQYHLYCIALHLYLKNRLPEYRYETHFGGAFYIFLRGVDQNQGPGHSIFYDLPDPSMIENFTETLLAKSS
jgi:exodeoxyribonuclease V beta subunit